ncbi:hypothetical protein LTR97_009582 [Elasticomyces elasticus]|uniref:Ribosomal RNA-processing protein 1 n=1 Tax=Elasticomyces elasticus TaxID=574655 RepID=A0AAN7VMT4_9PEZI|nr:hypothetical protein LTR97_009582 [Elasticomyces elasticus]
MAQQTNPFIKQLASSDRKLRTSALASLRSYLQSHSAPSSTPLTSLDLLKLWKALFYCLYMQDKPLHQQNLANDLADLTDVLSSNDEVVIAWLEAFWQTIAREWSGIDGLRMDKYLYLIRCYIRKGFEVCESKGWSNEEFLGRYFDVLKAVPLSARDTKIPDGLRYHVLDIYVDELEKVDGKHEAPIERVLEPVRSLGKNTVGKAVRRRAGECLADERLREWGVEIVDAKKKGTDDVVDEVEEEEEDAEFGGFD